MRISLTEKMVISDQVLAQEVGGETVLLDIASESYFGLDSIGTRVWQLINEEKPLGDVVSTLLEEYEVDREQLESDIDELLENLMQAGLVSASREAT